MKVSNMRSRNGNDVPNQFIISDTNKSIFQSYNSVIAVMEYDTLVKKDVITLDRYYWNYSRTTSKYLSMFLNECTGDIRKKIKDGTYILSNLN